MTAATAPASATHSSVERLVPLGSAAAKFRARKSTPGMVAALAAISARVLQPAYSSAWAGVVQVEVAWETSTPILGAFSMGASKL